LLVGRGSDEAIDLLIRAFCGAGRDAILIQSPTFGMYAVAAAVQDAMVVDAQLALDTAEPFDVDAVLLAVTPTTRIVFVCSPNNPTGGIVSRAEILRLATTLTDRALVVIDEAYIEFADAPSVATDIVATSNLAVLRTLSKAHALAGARVGSLIAAPELIGVLRRIMAPYPLPTPCVDAALAALMPAALAETGRRVALLVAERERLADTLPGLPNVHQVRPSRANFLCVRFHDADSAFAALTGAGLIVRDMRRHAALPDALRISIGTPEDNDRVIAALAGDGARREAAA
ncbi:MAG: histidinol-phosphate transaminase, partial [Lysobacterales bacterium]